MKPRKCIFCHNPETSQFFSPQLLSSSQQQSCTYLGNPPLLCYICPSTPFSSTVIVLKMVGSTSRSIYPIPSSCCSTSQLFLGLVPKPVIRKVTRVSQPYACASWVPTLLYSPRSTSSSCCPCSETCCGAGHLSRGRVVGFQQRYAAAQTFMLWALPQSLVRPVIDASHLINLGIWDNKAFIFLYRLLWFNYKI